MRILHFVNGLDANSGGVSRSVPLQCLASAGPDVEQCLAFGFDGGELAPEVTSLDAQGVQLEPLARGSLVTRLPALMRQHDVVHLHGLWSPAVMFGAMSAKTLGRPYVVSPHGMLEPWALAYHGWKKQCALSLGYRYLLQSAIALQATASAEASNLRSVGLKQPVAVIPNAVDVPGFEAPKSNANGPRKLLFLSRIHEKKGLLELVRAVKSLRSEFEQGSWRLVIAGTDTDDYWRQVDAEATRLGVRDWIDYVGAVDGPQKWELYRSASLFVLPTYSENFGLVVAEALGCGVPCITTHGAPWQELESEGCGWWHPIGQAQLEAALASALSTPEESLRAMGRRGVDLVKRRYSTAGLRKDLHDLYAWILGRANQPQCLYAG